jgi:hypothetical protein
VIGRGRMNEWAIINTQEPWLEILGMDTLIRVRVTDDEVWSLENNEYSRRKLVYMLQSIGFNLTMESTDEELS